MLVLTRKPGQSIKIKPAGTLPPKTPVGALFADGPIEVVVKQVRGRQVRLGITAHPDLLVLRCDLCEK